MTVALKLRGTLDAEALSTSLADVVARHESLRTLFPAPDGLPQQLIVSAERADLGWDVVDATGWPPTRLDEAIEESARHRLIWQPRSRCGQNFSASPTRSTCWWAWCTTSLLMGGHWLRWCGTSARRIRRGGRALAPGWPPLPVQYVDYTLWQRAQFGDLDDPQPHRRATEVLGRCPGRHARTSGVADRSTLSLGGRSARRHCDRGLARRVAAADTRGGRRVQRDKFHGGSGRPGGAAVAAQREFRCGGGVPDRRAW